MKSKKKQKIIHAFFFLVLFFIGNYYLGNLINNKVNHEISSYTLTNKDNLRTSGHWNLSPFVIDDSGVGDYTWEEASAETWCSGSGTFEEPYLIENVTIDGGNSGNCITINNSDKYFRIENFTVFNSGAGDYDAGIHLYHAGNGTLINNNCSFNNAFGILVRYSDNTTISGNTANNNTRGIFLFYSDNTTISGNNANNNSVYGICLSYSDITISGNTANNNSIYGIILDNSVNNTVSGNTANNNKYGMLITYSDITISGNTVNNNSRYGIYLLHSDNSTVSGNTANNNSVYGIYLLHSDSATVSGNTANNNTRGIYLDDSNHNLIINNNCSFNENGIYLYYSDNNTVSGNTANNNSVRGIFLYYYSDNNTVSGNTANNNSYYGITLDNSDNTTVSGNTANNNNNFGIYLDDSHSATVSGNTANNNSYGMYMDDSHATVSGNTVNNNKYGIYLLYSDNTTVSGNTVSNNSGYGINLRYSNNTTVSGNTVSNNYFGITLSYSNHNLIYKNYFNDNGGVNAINNGTDNKWDNGVIGNYWDDYAGVDANDDGIGDTPYIIQFAPRNQDNFPIWDDGDSITPVITIIFPLADSVFRLVAPNYNISIDELNLDTIWYTLDGGITNYTVTDLTGTFNQLSWGGLSEGDITIKFYANDTAGNIGSAAVTVGKDVSAPVITIIFPLADSVFDLVAPNYNISIDEPNLDTIWYTLDGGLTNYTVTGLTGTFNQLAWEALSEGSVTIRFYAKDTVGYIGFIDVEVIIEIPEDQPLISFGNYYIPFMFITITILSFIILEKRKKK